MQPGALRAWVWLHKWASLVCTVFMLLLCISGLPLIFSHEIHHLSGKEIEAPAMPADTPRASVDAVVRAAVEHHPGKVPLYLFAEADEPDLWLVKLDTRVDTDEAQAVFASVDARTAKVLGTPVFNEGVMNIFYRLHVDLFAGLPGKLFLGAMGLLLVISIVSGVVLYAPFMRKLAFGTVRQDRSPRVRWLDLHNLLGIVTLAWALVVGGTGIINTWAELILKAWQAEQTAALMASNRGVAPSAAATLPAGAAPTTPPSATPPATALAGNDTPVQRALDQALAPRPHMRVDMFAFPGTLLSTPAHYAVLLVGDTPLTARLQEPVLVEPHTGHLLAAQPRPWYATALQVSQPLHFGDYGGLPMKVLWALLDALTIVVLWSGLVLWWGKHRQQRTTLARPVAV